MKISKNVYLVFAILGAVIPWFFFGSFIMTEGVNLPLFRQSLFVNGAAGGFSADVLISATAFLIWSYADAQKQNIKIWWVLIPVTFLVGLSLALPLYFYLREE